MQRDACLSLMGSNLPCGSAANPAGPSGRPRSLERDLVVFVYQLGVLIFGRSRPAQKVNLFGDDQIGGPEEVTAFLREIGDPISRRDRREPELNTFAPGDPRDTTTPAAMAATLETMLTGDGLTPQSRVQLTDWMSYGGVTGPLIRASTPADWLIADRSGSGDFNRNIIAMVTPPDQAPYFITVFLSDADADFETRNGAVIDLSQAVMDVVTNR